MKISIASQKHSFISRRRMRWADSSGFTLVELSIVLVIIGLLTAGILAAQSMISTAKILSVVKQLSQYEIAVGTFRARFNQIPGDASVLEYPGDNSFRFDTAVELSNTWYHLSRGMGLEKSSGGLYQHFTAGVDTITPDNCPQLALKWGTATLPCLFLTTYSVDPIVNGFLYLQPKNAIEFSGSPDYDPISPKDAWALDGKMDDGLPSNGRVYGYKVGTLTTGECEASSKYDISNNGYACTMFFRSQIATP